MTSETFTFLFQVGNTILFLTIIVLLFRHLWKIGVCVYELIKERNCNCRGFSADRRTFIPIMKGLIKHSLISLFLIAIVFSVFDFGAKEVKVTIWNETGQSVSGMKFASSWGEEETIETLPSRGGISFHYDLGAANENAVILIQNLHGKGNRYPIIGYVTGNEENIDITICKMEDDGELEIMASVNQGTSYKIDKADDDFF